MTPRGKNQGIPMREKQHHPNTNLPPNWNQYHRKSMCRLNKQQTLYTNDPRTTNHKAKATNHVDLERPDLELAGTSNNLPSNLGRRGKVSPITIRKERLPNWTSTRSDRQMTTTLTKQPGNIRAQSNSHPSESQKTTRRLHAPIYITK